MRFPDFPEAITQADDLAGALREAADCLDEAIANRIVMNLDIPPASPHDSGQALVAVPASTALKAAFYCAIKELRSNQVQLAATLGVDEREIRRLLDPYHPSKLTRIQELLAMLGKRLVLGFVSENEPAQRVEPGKGGFTEIGTIAWDAGRGKTRKLYEFPRPEPKPSGPDITEIALIEQEELQVHAAVAFHSQADFDAITLIDAKIARAVDWNGLQPPLRIDIAFEPGGARVDKGCADIQTHFRFRALDSSSPEQEAMTIDCTLEASYRLAETYEPSTEELEAFQKGNAVFNAWPFFRELVQSNANRMAVPPPPVPFLRLLPRVADHSRERSQKETPRQSRKKPRKRIHT